MKKNRVLICLMLLTMILGSTGLPSAFADDSAPLTVTKAVIGPQQNAAETFKIVVTINGVAVTIELSNGGSMVFENLPYGSTYSVAESANTAYTVTYENEMGTIVGVPIEHSLATR